MAVMTPRYLICGFMTWINYLDQLFERHNLCNNRKVRFAKMMLFDEAKLYSRDVKGLFRDER